MTRTHAAVLLAVAATGVPAATIDAQALRDVPIFETSQAFELRFLLAERAYPMVVHVGPRGRVALVHPPAEAETLPRAAAGETIAVPDPASGLEWTLDGEPGYETFVLAAGRVPEVDVVTLEAELKAAAAAAGAERAVAAGRAAVVRAVEASLTETVGPTRSVTILHLP